MNYSWRKEIVYATKRIALDVKNGINIDDLNKKLFEQNGCNYYAECSDLVIRIGVDMRINNFYYEK